MFLKHLINPKPSIIIFFILFCGLFTLFPLINLEKEIVFIHSILSPFVVILIGILTPFFLGIGLSNIIYEKNIIKKENIVVGFVFVLITSVFINTVEAWISSFLLLFVFNYLIESYQKDLPFSQFYNASIILGSLTFIYPSLIWLTLILIINGINYSNLNWRILITILLGITTPYIFLFVVCFVLELPFYVPKFFSFSPIVFSKINSFHISKIIWMITILLIALASFFELFSWLYKKSIKSRRSFMTIIWFFIISVIIARYSGQEYFYFSLIPLAVIISNYFIYTKRRKIAAILFSLLVISSFYYKYMIVFNL